MTCFNNSTAIKVFPDPVDSLANAEQERKGQRTGIENGNCVLRLGPLEELQLIFPRIQRPSAQFRFRYEMRSRELSFGNLRACSFDSFERIRVCAFRKSNLHRLVDYRRQYLNNDSQILEFGIQYSLAP